MKFKMFNRAARLVREEPLCQPSEKDAESVNNTRNTEEFERCIVCGELTGIPISMPVDWRENYEIGVGQVCAECAKKQREVADRANIKRS